MENITVSSTQVYPSSSSTKSKLIKINHSWTIENFSFRYEKTGESLKSLIFSGGDNDKHKWQLQIYPRGNNQQNKDFVSISLTSHDKLEFGVNIKIYLLETNGKKNVLYNELCSMAKGVENILIPKEISRFQLLTRLMVDDKLTVFCQIAILSDTVNISDESNIVQLKVPESKLSQNFGNLLDTEKFSDVTLEVSGCEFKAHKAVLAARSAVFAAMFEHEMEENKLNRVVITDVAPEVLKEMLYYMYTDKAPNSDGMADQLLAVANKYDLEKLKAICEKSMVENLSIETAVESLIIADLYSAVQLKPKTIDFINSHTADVINTEGWLNITHPNLVKELFVNKYHQSNNTGNVKD